jgi:hypothetical protein
LIIWDRMFGSFEQERAPVRYGVTTPLASYNPVWANLHEFAVLAHETRALRGPRAVARLWLSHPALAVGNPSAPKPPQAKYNVAPRRLALHVYGQAVLLFIVINSLFLFVVHSEPRSWLAIACAGIAVLWSAAALLGWVEQRPWVRKLEGARIAYLLLTTVLCASIMQGWMP